MTDITRYDCDITFDDCSDYQYAEMTSYELGDYVRFEDHMEVLEKATAPKPPGDLTEFEETVKELTEWWVSKQGTTCEMAISYDDMQAKMEILAKYSQMMDDGVWAVHHCSACQEHHGGTRNLHAMIWRNTY